MSELEEITLKQYMELVELFDQREKAYIDLVNENTNLLKINGKHEKAYKQRLYSKKLKLRHYKKGGKLLPCPFCGSPPCDINAYRVNTQTMIGCSNCHMIQHVFLELEEAIEAWNTRVIKVRKSKK